MADRWPGQDHHQLGQATADADAVSNGGIFPPKPYAAVAATIRGLLDQEPYCRL